MRHLILITITIALACGCASRHTTNPNTPVDQSLYQPPAEVDITLSDRARRERETVINEENAYDTSLQHIDDKMSSENLDYQMCNAVSEEPNKQDCKEKLAKYCQENMMIDTRGEHHEKPYCRSIVPPRP